MYVRKEIHATTMTAAWIGLREVSVDGPLVWVNGSPLEAVRHNFKFGEPDENKDGMESCISIGNATHGMTMILEDRRCSNLKGYICEVRRACPPGYSQKFDGNCYRFVLDNPKDWYSARMDCKRHNFGDLLIFDQSLEIRFYNAGETLESPRTWPNIFIGLFRGSDGWRWGNGDLFSGHYVSKHRLAQGNNLCAVVDASRIIRSVNCTTPMPYACEIQRNTECFKENDAQDYSGKLTVTEKGRKCNAWNETQYSRRHNYCRYTPGRDKPWCFVNHGSATTWEFCYVGEPQKYCNKVYKSYKSNWLMFSLLQTYLMRLTVGLTPLLIFHPYITNYNILFSHCFVLLFKIFTISGGATVESCRVGQCPSGSICHPVSHECICPHGYEGLHCNRLCSNNRWGYKCSRMCPCGNDGNCDPVTGTARCNVTCIVDQSNTCSQACGMMCLEYLGCQCDVLGECICPAYVMGVGALVLVLFAGLFVCFVLCCLRKKILGESKKTNSFIRHLSLKNYPKDVESIDMWIFPTPSEEDPGIDRESTTRGSKESEDSGVETKDFHETTSLCTQNVESNMTPTNKPIPMKRNSNRLNRMLYAAKRNAIFKQKDVPALGANLQESVEMRGKCNEPPGAEYSSPYELRNKELLLGDSSEYYAFADPEVINNDVNGYVNDSVTKVRRKKCEDYRLAEDLSANKNMLFLSSIPKELIYPNTNETKTQVNAQYSLREWVQQKTPLRSKAKCQSEQRVGPDVKPKPRTKRMIKNFSKSDSELRRMDNHTGGGRKIRFNTTSGHVMEHSEDTSAPLLRSSSDSSHRKNSKNDVRDPTITRSSTDGVVLGSKTSKQIVSSIVDGNARFKKHKTTEPSSVYVNERIGRHRRLSQPKPIDVYEII
ncbi:uncharacterized protein [Antedon mediterranea]|uniref:uncharacterized protein n=1 Tax=Antedon mediterranea TaxID=105859 RepID=UPI003AF65819